MFIICLPIIQNFIYCLWSVNFAIIMEHPIVQTIKSRMAAIKSLDELTYLDLSNIECTVLPQSVKSLLQQCPNLYHLNLSQCGLQTLDNLPQIEITILELRSNKLNDSQLQKLFMYKSSLQQLSLENNHLQDINGLSIFQNFSKLQQINIKQNPLCQSVSNYSQKLFNEILPNNQSLKLIDYFRRNGQIMSDDEGKDDNLDGPAWLIQDNIEQEPMNNNHNQQSSSEAKSNEEFSINSNESNLIKLYEQQSKINPSILVKYLNEHERFVDPIDNCLDAQMGEQMGEYIEEEDEEEFKHEIMEQEFKCKQTKKRKVETQIDEQIDY